MVSAVITGKIQETEGKTATKNKTEQYARLDEGLPQIRDAFKAGMIRPEIYESLSGIKRQQ